MNGKHNPSASRKPHDTDAAQSTHPYESVSTTSLSPDSARQTELSPEVVNDLGCEKSPAIVALNKIGRTGVWPIQTKSCRPVHMADNAPDSK